MWWTRFGTATRMALLEHLRNRLAMWLVALYVPIWLTLAYTIVGNMPVRFYLRATDQTVLAQGNELTQISGALNAVTQIVGFMMFTVTFKSSTFDRRLAMAGYPRGHLLAAKVVALVLVSAVLSCYATAITWCFWHPQQPLLLAVSVFTDALTYGALGVMLGALLRGELEGMFLIVMISIIDISLQNPIPNPAADSDFLRVLPSYGAMQAATTAGFSTVTPVAHLLLQLSWCALLTCMGLLAFLRRTRDQNRAGRVSTTAGIPAT
ncbi:ABC transporter permease [Saccharopolyspora sp. ASAGF58]|uniref:ABC transporter permease n=1 Tax=Saccharopolyspora sp. ASAGF58 TaxID=2719023 RepID=UPI00143FCAEB|nr:ABC transporter permease [Saccharopolyspora sp. ASAGF58]QIZ35966.1 ABC transporter permease [Saccharopolyspora sp. ASAGF58]